MLFFQENATSISRGANFVLQKGGYILPEQNEGVSVYLLSNSFEYDIELIKKIPMPKLNYKNILIPHKLTGNIAGTTIGFQQNTNVLERDIKYVNNHVTTPKLNVLKYPYPNIIKDNLYIPYTDIATHITSVLRRKGPQYVLENIFDIFKKTFNLVNYSKTKVIIVDSSRYKLYSTLSPSIAVSDVINGLLCAYCYNPPEAIKKLDAIMIFKSPEGDYKFDLSLFEKRDVPRLQAMLTKIGKASLVAARTNEEAGDSVDSFAVEEKKGIEDTSTELGADQEENAPIESESQPTPPETDDSAMSLKDTLNKLSAKYNKDSSEEAANDEDKDERNLYNVKTIDINAQLIHRITPDISGVNSYERLSDEMEDLTKGNVEKDLMKNASQNLAGEVAPSNETTALNAISSEREREIREQVGRVKLNNVTFSTITSITDVPKPKPLKVNRITTTCPSAIQGTSFPSISEEYENKLLDRDIVATFMNFSTLPNGFYVTNVEVTDISNSTSLMNNWRVTLKHKESDTQSVINIKVPRVVNGRFFNNGIWYNIGKQDFPIPILKINKKTVMLTSNYNKITCERYDTKSLVDLGMLVKVITKATDANGNNKYVKVGNSSSTNSRFVSTIEYDEYAAKWVKFVNKEAKLELIFNRILCMKAYSFVTVKADEFCCGMLDQVPVVINTNTGLTRTGETITDLILRTLPDDLLIEYKKQKPGKMSMYTQITIGCTFPLGVAIAAWEGITSLLKKSGAKYQFVDKNFTSTKHFVIPFKDKSIAIESTIQNQLLFNGFYRINTKGYMMSDFETPIMNSNSVYVDIFNQLFFKQYSQLTTFVTYYNFFVDAITKDVCNHYHIPDDIAGMLIYASNLLADNNHTSENNAALYRIRSSEIIPAIIHFRLAFAISKYNNTIGSKTRGNKIVFNPNEVINELLAVPNVEPMSALNPMIEMHAREVITKKGFKGVNSERSYTQQKRTYEDSMIGKVAMSSPNSANVGIARQLVADPKIESVRGYTSTDGIEKNYNDFQLASYSELMTPGTVSRDDAIRTAIATSQTGHIVSTAEAQPVLISNGIDEVIPAYLSEEFSYVAREDGKVIDMNEDYLIIQYKSGKKKAVNIGHTQSFNSGSGFYVDNKLMTNFTVGQSFKAGDVLAYHEKFFSKDSDGIVRMNIGPLAKVAFAGLYATYEDAGLITPKMSKKLETKLMMKEEKKLDAMDDIESIVKVGTEVEIGDPLIVFGLGDTGDKSVDNFLKAFQKEDAAALDKAKRVVRAKHAGTVVDVRMYTTKALSQLSPSLYKIFDEYFKKNLQKRKILDKYDKTDSVYKLDTMYSLPTEPLKSPTIKGQTCDVLIEIYIEHADEASVGDKLAVYGASKQVLSEVVPEGQEPYTETRPDEEVSLFVTPSAILKRMIPSLLVTASGNKVLVELKRSMAKIWNEE